MAKVTLSGGFVTLNTVVKGDDGKPKAMSPKAVKQFLAPGKDENGVEQEYHWVIPIYDAQGNQIGTLKTGALRVSKSKATNLTAQFQRATLSLTGGHLVKREKVEKGEARPKAAKQTANELAGELLGLSK